MSKPKEMFSGLFEKYNDSTQLNSTQLNSMTIVDIRSRKGGLIMDNLILENSEILKIPQNLRHGHYVAFLANLEFNNIEFMNIFDLGKTK